CQSADTHTAKACDERGDGDEADPVSERGHEHRPPQAREGGVEKQVFQAGGSGSAKNCDLLGRRGHGAIVRAPQALFFFARGLGIRAFAASSESSWPPASQARPQERHRLASPPAATTSPPQVGQGSGEGFWFTANLQSGYLLHE